MTGFESGIGYVQMLNCLRFVLQSIVTLLKVLITVHVCSLDIHKSILLLGFNIIDGEGAVAISNPANNVAFSLKNCLLILFVMLHG